MLNHVATRFFTSCLRRGAGNFAFNPAAPGLKLGNSKLETVVTPLDFDVIVLGGGAAGLMCAIEAGKRGRRVAVLEHAERIGKKILISGGGRCNFTNLHCRPENFLSANPHFCKSALARYTPADFIALVEKHGIPYHEKKLGQLFCDGSAREIVAMLEQECARGGCARFSPARRSTEVRSADAVSRCVHERCDFPRCLRW